MSLGSFIPIILFIGFVLLMFAYSIQHSKNELRELRQIAPKMGFSVNENRYGLNGCNEVPPDLLMNRLKRTPLGKEFDMSKVSIRDVLEKKEGELTSYLFFYFHRSGGSTHMSTRHRVACFITPNLHLPYFRLQRKTGAQRLENLFGVDNVSFPDNPLFSKNYFVRGSDEAAIREVFTPDILSFFEKNTGLRVEGSEDTLLFYRSQAIVKAKDLPSFYQEAQTIYALFDSLMLSRKTQFENQQCPTSQFS